MHWCCTIKSKTPTAENKQALQNEMHASHKSAISTLEADHKKEMDSLIESHKSQIEEFQLSRDDKIASASSDLEKKLKRANAIALHQKKEVDAKVLI